MAYLGLVPTENSSSERRRQGHITKCGNAHARWLLVECAQHYASPPKVSKELSRRQQGQSARGPGHQLASSEPVASSLHASFGAATPAQQSDGGHRAGAVRFYLGTVAHATLLPGTTSHRCEKLVRGEQHYQQGGDTTEAQDATYKLTRSGPEAAGHGSQPTSSR